MVRFIPYLCYKRCLRQQKENRSIENSLKVNKGMLEMFSHIKQHMTSYDYCSMCKCTPGFSQCSIVLSGTYWHIQFFFFTVSGLMRTNFTINVSKDKIYEVWVLQQNSLWNMKYCWFYCQKFCILKNVLFIFVECLGLYFMHYTSKTISCICRFIDISDGFEWNLKYISKGCSICKVSEYFPVTELVVI